MNAPPFLIIDNVPPHRTLRSAALANAITAPAFEGRAMSTSRMLAPSVLCTWGATGNNPSLSDELTERTLPVRLNAGCEHPEERKDFRHPHLLDWLSEKHCRLVWAALTLIQHWVVMGCPRGTRRMGGFESFAAIMGGVQEAGSVPGFLANPAAARNGYTDQQSKAFGALVQTWWQQYREEEVGVADILPLALTAGVDLGKGGDQSHRIRLGLLLHERRKTIIGGKTIEPCGTRDGSQRYRLSKSNGDLRGMGTIEG